MSYILEALRKSAQERRAAESASLPNLIEEGQRPAPRRWPIWALGITLALNAATLLYFLWPGGGDRKSEPPLAAAAPPVALAPAAPSATLPAAISGNAATPVSAPAARPPQLITGHPAAPAHPADPEPAAAAARMEKVVPQRPARSVKPIETAMATKGERRIVARRSEPVEDEEDLLDVDDEEDLAAEEEPAPATAKPTTQLPLKPLVTAMPLKRSAANLPPVRVDPPPDRDDGLPSVAALPEPIREKLPPLKINLHAYSNVPSERFAVINMQRVEVGDSLPGGAKIVDIRPDSVVLQMEGARFRVPRP